MIRPALVVALLALAGCNTVTTNKPELSPLDARLTAKCDDPYPVKRGRLSQAEVVRAWGHDRIGLIDCGRRHAETVGIIERRDRALAGR